MAGDDSAFFSSDAPPHRERPSDVNEALSAGMAQRTNWVLTATRFPDLDEERRIADDCRAGRPDLASLSAAALVARARSVMPLERLMWRGHTIGSSCAAVGPSVITQVVGVENASLVVWLIGNAGDVDSAAPSFALWDLSRAVRDDDAVSKEFDEALDGLIDRLRTRQPEFAARFAGFLAEYGYRGPSEWDLGSESWETRPQLPLGLVDRLRHLPDDASPRAPVRPHGRPTPPPRCGRRSTSSATILRPSSRCTERSPRPAGSPPGGNAARPTASKCSTGQGWHLSSSVVGCTPKVTCPPPVRCSWRWNPSWTVWSRIPRR